MLKSIVPELSLSVELRMAMAAFQSASIYARAAK
jgi:hypothetical protein